MNKKGFTLMEILCVVALLGIISVIASVGLVSMSNNTKKNTYCAKLELIKTAALDYGKSHEKELNNSLEKYEGYKSLTITVEDLIKNGFPVDKDNIVINPMDNNSLNSLKIILYLKNNQVYSYIDDNNVC